MTDENRAKVNVNIELPAFKLKVEAEVKHEALDGFIAGLVETIEKSAKRIEKTFGSLRTTVENPPPAAIGPKPYPLGGLSDPLLNVARRLGIEASKLVGNNVFGFKEDKPQIFDPGKFKSAGAAARALLFLYEIGLEKTTVQYDKFQEAFALSKIKGRQLSQVVGDWTKSATIDSGRYKSSQELILSAKGANEAIEDLKSLFTK